MSVPTECEVRSWTPEERAEVARFLDRLVERPTGKSGVIRRRRISIGAAAVGALVMLAVLLASSAISILQRTSSTVARLRGLEGPPPSLWQQQFLVSPSPPEGR